jgi:prepilin-type N-terminal cleavage/methylation domain-containing protein
MRNNESGFNLIELMIVIAIMATLAAIAIPSYSHYLNKSRAISAVVLTEPVRTTITEYAMMHNGDLAGLNNQSLNMASTDLVAGSKDVSSIDIAGESQTSVKITATLADNLGNLVWTGQFQTSTENMVWQCSYASDTPLAHYAPAGCEPE